MKEFELKQVARNNSENFGCSKVTAAWLCGTEAQKENFISSLGENWVRIPAELVDVVALAAVMAARELAQIVRLVNIVAPGTKIVEVEARIAL